MDDDPPVMTLRESVKEIAIGSFAGIVSEVIEYPTDLAKVRLQAQLLTPPVDKSQIFKGPVDVLTRTFANEGFRGLYRGLPVPIAGSMIETGALFVSYAYFQNLLLAPDLLLVSSSVTPIELCKCVLQVQLMNNTTAARVPPIHSIPKPIIDLVRETPGFGHHKSFNFFDRSHSAPSVPQPPRLPGLVEVVRSTVATNGVRGLWVGHTGTILRETGGTSAWFAVKEWVASALLTRRLGPNYHQDKTSTLLPWESAVAGAVSGAACVMAIYPADTVKSAMQTEEELLSHRSRVRQHPKPVERLSFYRTFMKMYKAHGVPGLYAGGLMTALRAIPSSGIVFVVYDGLSAWIG
ncbi:hypothetical protein MIND_01365300 [Mycena indigotica]|uniref:Mitochondrial carrier n=1 Tax=Mycena indigotica TaxID=2126181 RepID=A0A8H6VQF0_9AGAR|nr:uncharacterized protein MIND_01365300 [Mycena indigotica]KAF7289904.1 hypothetical protein MIND_01365300 [Mycena indigotica]